MLRSFFIHIPRTGGSSIEELLSQLPEYQFLPKLKDLCRFSPEKSITSFKHSRIEDVKRRIPKTWFGTPYCFTFVRNPWDRLVSVFCHLQSVRNWMLRKNEGPVEYLRDFQLFVREVTNRDSQWLQLRPAKYSFSYARSQSIWLTSNPQFIGRFENLESDWRTVCDIIGIPHQKLPVVNKTKHLRYQDCYDNESKRLVAKDREEIIDRFKYVF